MTVEVDDPFNLPPVLEFEDGPEPEAAEPTPKRTRRRRSDAGQPRGAGVPAAPRGSAKLEKELLDIPATLTIGVAPFLPTVAAVITVRAEKTVKSVVSLSEGHPKFRAALVRASKAGPATELFQTGVMIFVAVNMDMGRLPSDHPMAMFTGVGKLHDEMVAHIDQEIPEGSPMDVHLTPPPPGFSPRGYPSNDPRNPMYSFSATPAGPYQ